MSIRTPSARYILVYLRYQSGIDGAPQVIATRPVQGISLTLFSEHGYRALEVLAQTSTPVRWLTILIVDASAPTELFPQLAARLPHLEALHIVALVQNYNLVCINPRDSFPENTLVLSVEMAGHVARVCAASASVRRPAVSHVHGEWRVAL